MPRWFLVTFFLGSSLAGVCAAQSSWPPSPVDQTPATAVPPQESTTKTPVPKKVWTNDDLSHGSGSVSVVGDRRSQKNAPTSTTATKATDPGTVSRIRQDLQKLQGQLDEINQKLKSFKDFQAGETVSTGTDENSNGYTRTPVSQQIPMLEQKKKKLEVQIDALVDEARKKGIEPGQLR